MERKIVEQGEGAHTISLPVQWIRKHGLHSGDFIYIDESENRLIITGKGKKEDKKNIEIKINHESERLIRIQLHGLYRLGYDKITVAFKTQKQRDFIEKICENYLLGFEITEDSHHNCVLENVSEPNSEKEQVILRRMFRILVQSSSLLHKEIKTGKLSSLDEIKQWTQKLDQYDNFCRRSISKQRFTEEMIHFYWSLYAFLHLIQRSILHLYETCCNCDIENKKIVQTSKIFVILLEKFHTGFFSNNISYLEEVGTKSYDIVSEKILPLIIKVNGKETILLYYLGEIARLISLASSPAISILMTKKNP